MRMLPTLSDLLPDYQAAVQQLQRENALTIDRGLKLVAALYQEVRIGDAEPGEGNDEDMLLFQYGIRNWYDGRGAYFGLDITRQVIVAEDEEQLIEQLSWEFEFDPAPFQGCACYTSWSTTLPMLAEWVSRQKATPGFALAQANSFRAVNLGVQQV